MGFKFVIEYKRGITNKAADELSRKEADDTPSDTVATASSGEVETQAREVAALLALAARPIPQVLDLIRRETATFPALLELVHQIKAGEAPRHLSWVDGLIYFNRRVLVDAGSAAKRELLAEHHCTPMAGHPGHERTFRLLAAAFFWPKMRKDVKTFVDECVVCQTTKYSTQKPAGLLQPLPVPSQVWEDVSMDFITGLP